MIFVQIHKLLNINRVSSLITVIVYSPFAACWLMKRLSLKYTSVFLKNICLKRKPNHVKPLGKKLCVLWQVMAVAVVLRRFKAWETGNETEVKYCSVINIIWYLLWWAVGLWCHYRNFRANGCTWLRGAIMLA